jgi:hypothetical protein
MSKAGAAVIARNEAIQTCRYYVIARNEAIQKNGIRGLIQRRPRWGLSVRYANAVFLFYPVSAMRC